MNILHITDIANPEGNGVAVAVENYAKYLSLKANVAIFCLDGNIGDNKVLTYNYSKYDKIENLPKPYSKPDIVVFNEVYKPKYIKLLFCGLFILIFEKSIPFPEIILSLYFRNVLFFSFLFKNCIAQAFLINLLNSNKLPIFFFIFFSFWLPFTRQPRGMIT